MKPAAVTRQSAAYIRVSTEDQNLSLQESIVAARLPDLVYSDQESGTNSSRMGYAKLLEAIQRGELSEVIIYRLDRLGRDPIELIRFFDLLDEHKVKFRSLTEPWLSSWNEGPINFLTWWLQLGLARFELLLLKDRQRRGIDAAKAQGKHLGRPRKK